MGSMKEMWHSPDSFRTCRAYSSSGSALRNQDGGRGSVGWYFAIARSTRCTVSSLGNERKAMPYLTALITGRSRMVSAEGTPALCRRPAA